MLLLLEGEIKVYFQAGKSPERLEVAVLGAGELVGIAGLLTGEPSAVTMAAGGKLAGVAFEPQFFQMMTERVPTFSLELARVLAKRLSQAVGRIPVPEADPAVTPPPDLLEMMPVEFMERHRLVPLELKGTILTVGFVDDPTPEAVQRLRTYAQSLELRAVRIRPERLAEALSSRVGQRDAEKEASSALALDELLRKMVSEGASDLHLSAGQHPQWRVDGEMREIEGLPILGAEAVLELLSAALPERNRAEFAAANDTDFAYIPVGRRALPRQHVPRRGRRRCGAAPDPERRSLGLEQLGMPPGRRALVHLPEGPGAGHGTHRERQVHDPRRDGGPDQPHPPRRTSSRSRTRSSSSTLARSARQPARGRRRTPRASRARCGRRCARTRTSSWSARCATSRRSSLALETANTGHLVFGTLHTATAVSTIDRIVGMFPPEQQSADPRDAGRRPEGGRLAEPAPPQGRRARGGARDPGGQLRGLEPDARRQDQPDRERHADRQSGRQQLLNESLAALVKDGTVEYEEALSKAVDEADLARHLNRPLTE